MLLEPTGKGRSLQPFRAHAIAAGQKVQAFEYEGRVEFVPVRTARSLRGSVRGSVRGIDTNVEREDDRA